MNALTKVGIVLLALAAARVAEAQHAHGGGDFPTPPRPEPRRDTPPPRPPGLLPPGSPRQIEVLVLDWGFLPEEIAAEVGETVALLVRASQPVCTELEIPSREVRVAVPVDVTVPVVLELPRAEEFELRCGALSTRVVVKPR